jgi:hypothetical protein
MSVSVSVSVSISVSVSVMCPCQLNTALRIFLSDMAIIPLISKARTRWRGNLKGLSLERGWKKSAENLGASPLKRVLSADTTFSHTNLAGQSL